VDSSARPERHSRLAYHERPVFNRLQDRFFSLSIAQICTGTGGGEGLAIRLPKSDRVIAKRPRGTLLVSSPEAPALDLVGYATRHAGGLIQVAGVLPEFAERIDP
jgi:hypothetical protein